MNNVHPSSAGDHPIHPHHSGLPHRRSRPGVPPRQTRRRLRGRQPLCGTGVTSWIPAISRPAAASERIAVSRPEPGPFTNTSTRWSPCSCAARAAFSAASCAANGVDFRDPLKPTFPALAQLSVFPCWSVIVTIVLLNVDLIWACPCRTFFFSRRFVFFALGLAMRCGLPFAYFFFAIFFLPAIAFFGPLRVLAFVWVRWPRTGSDRRCRMPW